MLPVKTCNIFEAALNSESIPAAEGSGRVSDLYLCRGYSEVQLKGEFLLQSSPGLLNNVLS